MQITFEGTLSGLYKADAEKISPTAKSTYLRFSFSGWLYVGEFTPSTAQAVTYYGVPLWVNVSDVTEEFDYYTAYVGTPVIASIDLTIVRTKEGYNRWVERLLSCAPHNSGWAPTSKR